MRNALWLACALLLAGACTNDYSQYQFDGNATGGTVASGGVGAAGGGGVNTGGSGGGLNIGGGTGGGVGATGGTGGGATGGTGGGTGGGSSCNPGQKLCAGFCVSASDPQTGCADPSCTPCALANATAQCSGGQCAIATCSAGFGDCDSDAQNGCELQLSDAANCGACGRACSSQNSLDAVCDNGACHHTCSPGFADCSQPTVGPDDGCEVVLASDTLHCGSCANDCTAQGLAGGFTCSAGVCGCSVNGQCASGGANGSCSGGVCVCGSSQCRPGEACTGKGPNTTCSCNQGSACGAGETCCQTPAGCFDLETDANNCGGCGFVCATGEICQGGACIASGSDAGTDAADAADAGSDAADAALD